MLRNYSENFLPIVNLACSSKLYSLHKVTSRAWPRFLIINCLFIPSPKTNNRRLQFKKNIKVGFQKWLATFLTFGIDPIESYSISNGNLQRMEVQSGSIMMHAELSVTSYLPLVQGSLPLNGQTSSWFLLCKGGWGDEITSPLSPTFSPGFHFSFWSLELCSPPTKTYVRDIQI